ncbi:flagellar hook-associated protein FlgL [Parachitinimonas caeni]|uniref:Flagellar hook-associated protein FlgL n=1 Tax=Parachitinimonas caeni TaxID=3031301 RepID=A0ABT7DUH2_9NEIS|nr:flagellar hook-associated protein FlgL [Parachitinimonas caeni]MDK2123726.1 flagellar hook-associated protein FlgL [Parachitinimonas caeni]
MRVSTNTIYDLGVSALQNRQAELVKHQQQLSTGRRILSPADDPVSAARTLDLTQSTQLNEQYIENTDYARGALSLAEGNMQQVIRVLQDVQTLAVNAGNPSLTLAEKKMLDQELRGRYAELIALGNSTDGNGQYLFSGFQGSTQPFTELNFGSVTYNGDEGQRRVQISTGRQIPVSDSGADLFFKIKDGNGTYATGMATPDLPNSITLKGGGSIVASRDWASAYTASEFKIDFDGTNYTITRLADNAQVTMDHAALQAGVLPGWGVRFVAVGPQPQALTTGRINPTVTKNVGTGVISTGVVTDPNKWADPNNVQAFRVQFHSVNDPNDPTGNRKLTRYDIIDNRPVLTNGSVNPNFNKSMIDGFDYTAGTPLGARDDTPGNPNTYPRLYKPGGDIELRQLPGENTPLVANWDFGGKFDVSGVPADGDSFAIRPSVEHDIFSTLGEFSTALTSYQGTDDGMATLQNRLNGVIANLNNSLGQVLGNQSNIGARLKEMDAVRNTNQDLNIQYKDSISRMNDLDYAKAITDFSLTQTYLDAARRSFAQVQNLSLFQYVQ